MGEVKESLLVSQKQPLLNEKERDSVFPAGEPAGQPCIAWGIRLWKLDESTADQVFVPAALQSFERARMLAALVFSNKQVCY